MAPGLWCKVPRKYIQKREQESLYPEIIIWLLKVIHSLCREQFHVGNDFFTHHCTEGRRAQGLEANFRRGQTNKNVM